MNILCQTFSFFVSKNLILSTEHHVLGKGAYQSEVTFNTNRGVHSRWLICIFKDYVKKRFAVRELLFQRTVVRSKQFPFRFFSAFGVIKELEDKLKKFNG